ncbi:LacI family DNA-binding transcriptional regulator [uncultured Clostridium sp.]|uniref:LacI family DNA-binding transcriptional regulator n=1 Tax=uncultured Clostridium sp. TaxID=59620 RepID=UPI0025ED4E3B|nr:LacI family DNA-binding transcriptional regulator [uncultured Clostridium sp.]
MITIADVAREAGVSVATVSRVLNKNGPVSPVAHEKVNLAIAKLNYQPNVWGRRLRRKESRMLLILVPTISNPFYSSIVAGIEDEARRYRFGTMLCITNGDEGREREFIELLFDGQADGAVMLCVDKDDKDVKEIADKVPIVQCCEFCKDADIAHVSIDNFAAAAQVVRYLRSLGHEKIGFVGSVNQFVSSEDRRKGYEAEMEKLGLPVRKEYMTYADRDYSFQSGIAAARELLTLPDRPTAIFCISDVLAMGAIRAAEELGLSVPGELSVVGFDDVEYATMMNPMLTTVSQPLYPLGKTSARMLIEQIEAGEGKGKIFLEHKLVIRDSTAQTGP